MESDPVAVALKFGFLAVLYLFLLWEVRMIERGKEPLVRPEMLRNPQLGGGLTMFFFQYMIQAGLFFIVPLFLRMIVSKPCASGRVPGPGAVAAIRAGHSAGPPARRRRYFTHRWVLAIGWTIG